VDEIRVLLADDHRGFADAVAMRLQAEPGLTLVGVTGSGTATEARLSFAEVDVLVMDVELGAFDGLAVVRRVVAAHPRLHVVLLTERNDPEIAAEAFRLGARGFLTKDVASQELVAAIRGAIRGETWVSRRLLTSVIRLLVTAPSPGREESFGNLTKREREVLECMVAGMNRAAIAEALFVSTNTVRTHTQRLLGKLGVHSSIEAVAAARRAGLTARRSS